MSTTLNLDMSKISNFNLGFLVNMGASRWYYDNEKMSINFLNQQFKEKIPKNNVFEINSMIFNIPKHKQEILSKYKCYFKEEDNELYIIISESLSFQEFTKEIMMNLYTFCEKLGIETICFLVSKTCQQYVRIMQDLMIVGFRPNEDMKEINIQGETYKVMEMPINADEKIEEFFF